jgi:hypothetical protein
MTGTAVEAGAIRARRRNPRPASKDSLVPFPELQGASAGLPTPCACGTTPGIARP